MADTSPAAIEAERQRQDAAGGGGGGQSPQDVIAFYTALAATPQGQAAMRAQGQTAAMNIKIANASIKAQAQQIAIQKGQAAATAWYQQQQVKISQKAHELAVQTQQQNFEIQSGQLTGNFQGQPTLANLGQQGQQTGYYGGAPTLAREGQEQQFGLSQGALMGNYQGNPTLQATQNAQNFGINQGALTGEYQGAPTLAALQNAQNFGLNQAGVTGYYGGNPTLANQQFVTGATGYYGGAPTLAREQAAAGTALQAGQLGASLQGPSNWARFLQAQNGVNGSAASNLVASVPGGLGASAGPNPAPMTLASVLGGFGVAPQAGAGTQHGQQVWAGGTAGFNEANGQQSTGHGNDVMSGGGGPVYQNEGGQAGAAGWNPSSPMGALGQVMSAPRVTNAQLGLSDQEASTLQGYFDNPNQAPTGWYESKSPDERSYLGGLLSYWGGSPDTFTYRYRNSRPNQGSAFAA